MHDADSQGGGPGSTGTEGIMKQGGLAKKKKPKVKKNEERWISF